MITSNQGRVEVATPAHVYAASPLSDTDAAWLGARAKIVTAHPKTLQGKEATVAAGGALVGTYTKTSAVSSATALPESGYAHKLGGTRKYDKTWHVYTTQPDSPAWLAYHLNELRTQPAWSQCIFSDSLILSYSQGGKPARPPAFTTNYTLDEWLALEGINIAYWAAATGKPIIVNGLTEQTITNLAPGIGMIENAFGSHKGTLPTAATWRAQVKLLQQAQLAGWTPWAYVKLPAGADRDAWRSLTATTMLLVDEGSLLYELGGAEGTAPPWVSHEYDHPAYQPGIGLPTGPMYPTGYPTDPAYRRDFTDGFVVVNPGTAPYTTPEGVTADAQSGVIARRRDVTTTYWDVIQ